MQYIVYTAPCRWVWSGRDLGKAQLKNSLFFQDLVNKFTSLVMPEVTRCIVCEDPSFTEMLDSVESIKLTMFPDLPLSAALRQLHEQLHQYSIKNVPADLSTTSAVEEMKNKLSAIMMTSEEAGGKLSPTHSLSRDLSLTHSLSHSLFFLHL